MQVPITPSPSPAPHTFIWYKKVYLLTKKRAMPVVHINHTFVFVAAIIHIRVPVVELIWPWNKVTLVQSEYLNFNTLKGYRRSNVYIILGLSSILGLYIEWKWLVLAWPANCTGHGTVLSKTLSSKVSTIKPCIVLATCVWKSRWWFCLACVVFVTDTQ